MKIAIIGHCGSGKTTLAKRLSEKHDILRLELDRLFFKHGGASAEAHGETEHQKEIRREKILSDVKDFLARNDSWVSDGSSYKKSQILITAEADQIIFIDIPLWRRQWNHIKRLIKNRGRHPELSVWQDIYFTYDMIRRTRNTEPLISELLKTHPKKITSLRSYRDIDTFCASLASIEPQ